MLRLSVTLIVIGWILLGGQVRGEEVAPKVEPKAETKAETKAEPKAETAPSEYEIDYEEEPEVSEEASVETAIEKPSPKVKPKTKPERIKGGGGPAVQGSRAKDRFVPILKSETKSVYQKGGKHFDVDPD